MSFTAAQQEAIAARGNVLVVAGAGTGKTRTLVERCLDCLLAEAPRASLDEILVVTFTDAAAAEMRQRIRRRLEEELQLHPDDTHWQEQLALFETAHLGTLHSFCLQLVRQHFYELELDPQVAVLAEEEARLLADETLEQLLQKHYAGRGSAAEAVQQLIQAQGRGWDRPVRTLVLRLHHYTQTRPDPAGWLRRQLAMFAAPEPATWRQWWLQAVADSRSRWLSALAELAPHNDIAAKCATILQSLNATPAASEIAAALDAIAAAQKDCPFGKKALWLKPLEGFLDEASFLASLAPAEAQLGTAAGAQSSGSARCNKQVRAEPELCAPDPLAQDWAWVRGQMTTLLQLAGEFTRAYTEAKRELGVVDFHDLEQYALRLLWDPEANQPTKVARQWRKQLRFIFVDEYQDINAAQDKIIEALSRHGAQANRFLVGDVKQSIYRFRLADPHIFQTYIREWGKENTRHAPPSTLHASASDTVIPLVDNFRSREKLLDFINSLFGLLMQPAMGGVAYDAQARLRFGASEESKPLSAAADPAPCVELHLRLKGNPEVQDRDEPFSDALAEVRDLEEADKEARLVAMRLRELKAAQQSVWDKATNQFRPADWRDMAVLLRSPSGKAESYAKEFARLGVPLQVARGGFYQSLEISDLLSLLQLLDNPLQDLPALAVLHSPLVGLTLNELATIRLTVIKARFWTALLRWQEARTAESMVVHRPPSTVHRPPPSDQSDSSDLTHHASRITDHASETYRKVTTFLDRFTRWRRLARQVSLSRCLEAVLSETHYADWLLTQPRGEQRHANVQRLLSLAQEFDQFQRQGLFRFLRFIEAQQQAETEPEVAAVSEENAVRLMSIHQSKGLEFPIVAAADLGKPFNLADLRAEIILDEEFGLCPQIKPPHTGKRYPSLPYWLARQRQNSELLGEELRLLYVAMTRARDLLLLSAGISAAQFHKVWQADGETAGAPDRPPAPRLLAARSYADWIGLWFARTAGSVAPGAAAGQNDWLRWTIHDDSILIAPKLDTTPADEPAETDLPAEPAVWQQLQQRLSWKYAFDAATRQPAKSSVSVLRRRAALADEETAGLFQPAELTLQTPRSTLDAPRSPHPNGAYLGTAHHLFLQHVSLAHTGSVAALRQEAERLQDQGLLLPEEVALLDFKALAAFWGSDLGRKVLAQAPFVRRELAFTARFTADELARLTGAPAEPALAEEFVVVQGVADLAVVLPGEIQLLDFKTDAVKPKQLADKVKAYEPQLKLYARALSQIYRRPVSECWLCFLTVQKTVAVKT